MTATETDGTPPFDDESLAFLLKLLDEPAPSGFEAPAAALWQQRARDLKLDVSSDAIGNSFAATGGGGGSALRVAVVGHVDEIGFIVTKIDSKGFLKVAPIGGWDPVVVPGQRIRILGTPAGRPVRGSISRAAVHLLDAAARDKVPKISDLVVDIGAASDEEARALVRIGDPVVMDVSPVTLDAGDGHRLMSRSIDNRIGAFVALEVARACRERQVAADVVAVGSTREEIGGGGAQVAMVDLAPDRVCVVDTTAVTETPASGGDIETLKFRSGPIIPRGSTLTATVTDELIAAAQDAGLDHQLRAKGMRTATDADQTIRAGAGMATGLVSIPGRYLHTPIEQVDLRDVRDVIELVTTWIAYVARVAGSPT